ncbi:MAG: stage V sporulation protein M [Clostridia bacterium]|nr:stage V sporulation protein M [Clostridia bacterium]
MQRSSWRDGRCWELAGGEDMRMRMVCIRLPKFMGGMVRKIAYRRRK